MAQHVKLRLDVGAISLGQQSSKLGLDLGLLVQQLANGGVQVRVIRGRQEGRRGVVGFRALGGRHPKVLGGHCGTAATSESFRYGDNDSGG